MNALCKGILLVALVSMLPALMSVLAPGQAHAESCTGTQTSHNEADCLSASWGNRGLTKKSWYEVRNECSDNGTMVVFVDRTSGDHKHTLANDNTVRRTNRSKKHVRDVYCCASESDLCNEADITAEGCDDNYQRSSADDTCLEDVDTSIDSENRCVFQKACRTTATGTTSLVNTAVYQYTSLTVEFGDADNLHNCDGTLTNGGC